MASRDGTPARNLSKAQVPTPGEGPSSTFTRSCGTQRRMALGGEHGQLAPWGPAAAATSETGISPRQRAAGYAGYLGDMARGHVLMAGGLWFRYAPRRQDMPVRHVLPPRHISSQLDIPC